MAAWFADWVAAEQGRFVLLLPVAMGAAILIYFALPSEPPLWLAWLLPAASLAALVAGWRYAPARLVAAILLAGCLGFARAELRTAAEPPQSIIPSGAIGISGTIARIEFLPDSRRITLTHPSFDAAPPLARAIRLRLRPDDLTPLEAGEGVQTYAMLFGPERPAYPGAWDSGRQDFYAGIGATGFALTPVTITALAPPDTMGSWLQTLRTQIAARIMATLPVATGSIAVTLLTGDAQAIPTAERDSFIAAGLAHLLAVAGLHVGIVMGLAFAASRFLLSRHERLALHLPVKPLAAAFALLAGAGYAALTGAHLPILRSLAMASLVTLGVFAGRRAISLRGLALAAMLILLATPEAVIGVSFQMSFSAVLALISGYAAIQPILLRLRSATSLPARIAVPIGALAYTSLLAGAASMPFAAYQFQQVQPYWIPANLIAVPLAAFWIMPWGLLALALMPVSLSALALIPMGWGIGVIVWLTAHIAAWPAAMLRLPPMPDLAILLIAAGLIWLCIWRSTPRFAGILLLLAGLAVYADARPPDILVSPDARLIAIQSGRQIFLIREPKATAFTLAQWAPVWGGAPLTFAQCPQNICRLGPILFAQTPPTACGDAAIVVSPQPLRGVCGAMPAIDRFSVYENGATAAWIKAGAVQFRTDRQIQGRRPWVLPYPILTTLR
jgi:competence protein ComEC